MITATVEVPGETRPRLAATSEATELLRTLWSQHGPLMFHQSGGCCDGSSPMCFPAGDFSTSPNDILLGILNISSNEHVQSVEFWMSREQFEYWSHTFLTIDVVKGVRFLIRSTMLGTVAPFA